MGYRSEVVGLVYGKESKVDEYLALHKIEYGDKSILDIFNVNPDPNDLWVEGISIVTRERNVLADPPRQEMCKYIKLYGADWKWYEDFEDVKTWHLFMQKAEEFGLDFEFARVGEDQEDTESEMSSNADYVLEIRTEIRSEI